MKLIDILVQELPKRGGWPEGANEAVQDDDGTIKFFDSNDLEFNKQGKWCGSPRGDFYCTKSDKITGYLVAPSNRETIITREQYEAALKQSVWDGTGAPPVGIECEWLASGDHDWVAVTVLVYDGNDACLKPSDGSQSFVVGNVSGFRPIRSERDKTVSEMLKLTYGPTEYNYREICEILYDAGYRKLSD